MEEFDRGYKLSPPEVRTVTDLLRVNGFEVYNFASSIKENIDHDGHNVGYIERWQGDRILRVYSREGNPLQSFVGKYMAQQRETQRPAAQQREVSCHTSRPAEIEE